jgi:Patatin-like phospholipase
MPQAPPRRRLLGAAAAALALPLLPAGCARPVRLPGVPSGRAQEATVLGLPNERFRLAYSTGGAAIEAEFLAAAERIRRFRGLPASAVLPPLNLLAVSGGGENGAFGAGLLTAWTERGDRPVFDLVTGVSTGALTAPFAYLGSAWDAQLRAVYTEITLADVLVKRGLTAAVWDDALSDTTPLFGTISRQLDDRMLAAIAEAYGQGRLLLVGSTDLDAQMPVIWNIGAIAASGHPRALDTIRRILLASAAIPGAFPPVMFDVTLDGRPYQEMHVDGGAFAQAFLYPPAVTRLRREAMARRRPVPPATAWVIRNGRLDPEWSVVERRTYGIAGRAISSMIAASGFNDVLRISANTQRDGVDYNLAFIGRDFDLPYGEPFEQAYMRALYEYGRRRMLAGDAWAQRPPS